ncbi:unnamed protein product [Lasius platythorax]|uniref:Uncharacterized protein n=1 Tax=Lasius platythorax TaxID=488582 RepID=A0AAV2NZD0_9HYME
MQENNVLRKWWSIQTISARQKKESPSQYKKKEKAPYMNEVNVTRKENEKEETSEERILKLENSESYKWQ